MIFEACVKGLCWPLTNRLLLTMKLVIVISLLAALQATAGSYAQTITLKAKNITLAEAMRSIQKQSGYPFFLNGKTLAASRLDTEIKSATLEEAMAKLLGPLELEWVLKDETIVVKPRRGQVPEESLPGSTKQQAVTGRVGNALGQPLAGATVSVKGTTSVTTTDNEGNYRIEVPGGEAVLVFSSVGYSTVEEVIGTRDVINMVLKEAVSDLEEVVVVGYGVQKKETATGAIASIKGTTIASSPATNVTNNLLGRVPGLSAISPSGEPGRDGANLLIRGMNTLGNNSPLIIVNGVPNRNFERINPNDIESITVLKDASAAIYGSQAANGAIIVTTKRGSSGKPRISLDLGAGINQPTRVPKMADAVQYTTLLNELEYYKNPTGGWNQRFTQEDLRLFADGSDPWGHPNTDWFAETLKDWSAQHQTSATLSGGTENVQYFISVGEKFQDAYYKKSSSDYRQYNFRSNVDAKVNAYIDVAFDLAGRLEDYNLPTRPTEDIIWSMITRGKPNMAAYWPNGDPGPDIERGDNPVVIVSDAPGYDKVNNYVFEGNFRTNIRIPWVEGLTLTGNAAYDRSFRLQKVFNRPWYLYTWDGNPDHVTIRGKRGLDSPQLTESYSGGDNYLLNTFATYTKTFGADHHVKVMAGMEGRAGRGKNFGAFRRNFISEAIEELFAGAEDQFMSNWGSASRNAYLSYFGRANYDYANKYLLEFLWRYDGSYMFPKDKRFGFFPGVSVGWRISEEGFWDDNGFVNDLKLRASWGQTGNDRIAEYQYLATYGFSDRNYGFGIPAIDYKLLRETKVPNPNVTWEVANQFNVGFDAHLFDNRFFATFDYFRNLRSQILVTRNASVPGSTGLVLPPENIGKVSNEGFEIDLGYRGGTSDFDYSVMFNASYSYNKIVFWDETPGIPEYQQSTGRPMGSSLYYEAIGIFRDQAAVDAYPHLPGAAPGDVIFRDVNGDEVIDGLDRVMNTKSNMPRLLGGLTLNFSYKNAIDLNLFFQGAAGAVQYIDMVESGDWGNYYRFFADDHWTPENTSAKYPRAYNRSELYWTNTANTFWLKPTDYIRLKNIELGYSFSQSLTNKLGVDRLRIYANAYNLFTIDRLKYFDPEAIRTGRSYPAQRIINLGLGLTF